MSLFAILHTAVGIWLLYSTVAGFLNTTRIRVGQGTIQVRSGPLPWPGNIVLDSDDVHQLYCREKVSDAPESTYHILAICKNKRRATLLKGLTDEDQALYIEQEIERFLGIEDRRVLGEVAR